MPHVGVRKLKARALETIRAVRDHRARYVITYRGGPPASPGGSRREGGNHRGGPGRLGRVDPAGRGGRPGVAFPVDIYRTPGPRRRALQP